MAEAERGERMDKIEKLTAIYTAANRRDRRPHHRRDGLAEKLQQARARRTGARRTDAPEHGDGTRVSVGRAAARLVRRSPCAPRPRRCRRRDRAVERPAVPDHAEDDSRTDRRLHRRGEACARNAFRRHVVGRNAGGDRSSGGRGSIVPGGRETGERLVRHPGVDKISFTGSSATGRHIAALCGEQLKRVSLELGGKSAAIILDDADIATPSSI